MLTTPTSPAAWRPDILAFDASEAIPDALIVQTSTKLGVIEGDAPAVRVAYVDDVPATFVPEGSPIPESDPELSEVLVYTGKVAQLVRLSREQWAQPGASANLAKSVARSVTKAANIAYLTQPAPGSGKTTPPAGILNVPGILDAGAFATNLDGLIDAVATIETNHGTPSHILLAPDAWASLRKFKTQTGSAQSLLNANAQDAVPTLLGIRVTVTSAMPSGTGLVLDRNAIASAYGTVQVAQSEHAYFNADSVGLRCTWRFGANIVHPDRIAKFTVTAPSKPA